MPSQSATSTATLTKQNKTKKKKKKKSASRLRDFLLYIIANFSQNDRRSMVMCARFECLDLARILIVLLLTPALSGKCQF
jgi:hypothetical protein